MRMKVSAQFKCIVVGVPHRYCGILHGFCGPYFAGCRLWQPHGRTYPEANTGILIKLGAAAGGSQAYLGGQGYPTSFCAILHIIYSLLSLINWSCIVYFGFWITVLS